MEGRESPKAHILVVPYPSQGHINPMIQFSRRLATKGVKATLAITNHIFNTLNPSSGHHVSFATISDGYDEGGYAMADSADAYLARFEASGSHSLIGLIEAYATTADPVTCVVYDSFLPWALDVAKKYNLKGAAFFTQACAVNYVFFMVHCRKLTVPVYSPPVEVPGLPPLEVDDLPSFVSSPETYPAYNEMVMDQYSNLDKADFVLVNTCYYLEDKVVDAMCRQYPILTIGPTIPSFYLENRVEDDKDYGPSLYKVDSETSTMSWLSTKPPRSVVYVSFGSMASLSCEQMEELAWGLKESNFPFLWVVRASEEEKLPEGFAKETGEEGLILRWAPQLAVLASDAVGCFFTHCGWNSTLEALASGLPMIGMPQWTDQPTDAKLIQDVWKVGVRVKGDDKGVVRREEVTGCIKEVMEGDRREELVENANTFKELIKKAVSEGGTSDRNIDEFISKIASS